MENNMQPPFETIKIEHPMKLQPLAERLNAAGYGYRALITPSASDEGRNEIYRLEAGDRIGAIVGPMTYDEASSYLDRVEIFGDRVEAKRERYGEMSDKAIKESAREFKRGDMSEAATGIPFGQPILVGHHSEGRHRRTIERAHNAMRRGIEAEKKAGHYAEKAESYGKSGISSDDPEAVVKLREKLTGMEERQAQMKAANKLVKKKDFDGLVKMFGSAVATQLTTANCFGGFGFEAYQLSNNNANMRRIRQRIKTLEQTTARETTERTVGDVTLIENVEINRVQLIFPGKPSGDIRANLKSHGFRWSPSQGAWQRQLNANGTYAAERVLKFLKEVTP